MKGGYETTVIVNKIYFKKKNRGLITFPTCCEGDEIDLDYLSYPVACSDYSPA